jgi:hypothetical protein
VESLYKEKLRLPACRGILGKIWDDYSAGHVFIVIRCCSAESQAAEQTSGHLFSKRNRIVSRGITEDRQVIVRRALGSRRPQSKFCKTSMTISFMIVAA